ncbi:MAG TPA: KTSC domain-containing protein [Chitinophagaceae bacterium]|nr:KTSC domain-containing protein [Chitinophagaceae bacterium]
MPSSVISTINYNKANAILSITFVSGMVYDYKNVPEEIYMALISSGSKGIFFNKHIKGSYKFKKVT